MTMPWAECHFGGLYSWQSGLHPRIQSHESRVISLGSRVQNEKPNGFDSLQDMGIASPSTGSRFSFARQRVGPSAAEWPPRGIESLHHGFQFCFQALPVYGPMPYKWGRIFIFDKGLVPHLSNLNPSSCQISSPLFSYSR